MGTTARAGRSLRASVLPAHARSFHVERGARTDGRCRAPGATAPGRCPTPGGARHHDSADGAGHHGRCRTPRLRTGGSHTTRTGATNRAGEPDTRPRHPAAARTAQRDIAPDDRSAALEAPDNLRTRARRGRPSAFPSPHASTALTYRGVRRSERVPRGTSVSDLLRRAGRSSAHATDRRPPMRVRATRRERGRISFTTSPAHSMRSHRHFGDGQPGHRASFLNQSCSTWNVRTPQTRPPRRAFARTRKRPSLARLPHQRGAAEPVERAPRGVAAGRQLRRLRAGRRSVLMRLHAQPSKRPNAWSRIRGVPRGTRARTHDAPQPTGLAPCVQRAPISTWTPRPRPADPPHHQRPPSHITASRTPPAPGQAPHRMHDAGESSLAHVPKRPHPRCRQLQAPRPATLDHPPDGNLTSPREATSQNATTPAALCRASASPADVRRPRASLLKRSRACTTSSPLTRRPRAWRRRATLAIGLRGMKSNASISGPPARFVFHVERRRGRSTPASPFALAHRTSSLRSASTRANLTEPGAPTIDASMRRPTVGARHEPTGEHAGDG